MSLAPEYRVGSDGDRWSRSEPGDFVALILRAVDGRHRGGFSSLHDLWGLAGVLKYIGNNFDILIMQVLIALWNYNLFKKI